jgi:hypothetical protein
MLNTLSIRRLRSRASLVAALVREVREVPATTTTGTRPAGDWPGGP